MDVKVIMITQSIIIFILLSWNILNELLHRSERKDLYNRILARDSFEYKQLSQEENNHHKRPKNPIREKMIEDGILKKMKEC